MPWNQLSPRFAYPSPSEDKPLHLTLVTLALVNDDPAANAFYASTEFEMLTDWARTGKFVLAFAADDRAELTLVCADSVEIVRTRVKLLPFVEAGIAIADIRAVSILRFAGFYNPTPTH